MENSNKFLVNTTYDPLILRTIVKRYWWWPLVLVLLFGSIAFVYLRYTKPIYQSNLVLQLSENDNARDVIDIENINSSSRKGVMSGTVELLRSELLFEKAMDQLNLNVSVFSRGQILTEELYQAGPFHIQPYHLKDSSLVGQEIHITFKGSKIELTYGKNGSTISVAGNINQHIINDDFDIVIKSSDTESFSELTQSNDVYFVFNNDVNLSGRLISGLNITLLDAGAKTVEIAFKSHNQNLSKDVVESVSKAFFAYDEDLKRKGSENIVRFIDNQLDSLELELRSSKDSLMQYTRKAQIADIEGEGDKLGTSLSKYQDDLFLIEEELNSLNYLTRKLSNNPNRLEVYRLIPEMLGKSYEGALTRHIEELLKFLETKEDLMFDATEENPSVRVISQKIESKKAMIQRSIEAINSRLASNAKVLKEQISGLESSYYKLPEKKMEYSRLKNINELNEKYFTLLTEKKVLYEISDAGYTTSNRVLRQAKVNPIPISPNKNMIYLAFGVMGGLVGLMIMLLRYLRFNEVNLIEDLENILPAKATILGGIPLISNVMEYSQLIVHESPKSALAEAYRKVRTNLNYINPNYQTIAISSSISGEGKTFVALNLGGIIAMTGRKTILLDLDMRKPKVHLGVGVENKKGMSSILVGQSTLEESIQKSKLENYDFITAGPVPPNPSELLLSKQFGEIVKKLKTMYDVVIIDNPPIGLVSDGVKILTDSDIPIYIFKSHYSKRNFVGRIKELFELKQLRSLNVILNGVSITRAGYGYGYGYGYTDESFKIEARKKLPFWKRIFTKK